MMLDFNRYKKEKASKAIVAIHGWGGNKESFLPFVKNFKVNNVEWFLPEAPYLVDSDTANESIELSLQNNSQKKSWTYKKSNGTWEIYEPIKMLNNFFNNLIFQEYQSQNVYVLGFSQGAAVCYEYVMGIEKTLGGIFPIGGFLFKQSVGKSRVSSQNKNTPIIIGHGKKDEVVPIKKSKIAYDHILKEKANVKLVEYNGGHKISMSYLKEIKRVIDGKQ